MENFILENLQERGYCLDNYSQTWIDTDNNIATFPLYNLSGILVGYQQYNPSTTNKKANHPKESRYFTYRPRNMTAMFGLESLSYRDDVVFVQEGVFDVCKFHSLGVPAVAILSSRDTQSLLNIALLGRKVCTLADGDKAGKMLFNWVVNRQGGSAILLEEGMDAGDMSLEDLKTYSDILIG